MVKILERQPNNLLMVTDLETGKIEIVNEFHSFESLNSDHTINLKLKL